MLSYVPIDAIRGRHLHALAESLNACPAAVRPSAKEMIEDLHANRTMLFETEEGIVVLSKQDNRLCIDAATTTAWRCNKLAADLKRLAAEWQCDTIETTVFDSRLAAAILRVGAQVESTTLVLAVGSN